MSDGEGGPEDAARPRVDPRIDRIEFVAEEGAGDPPQTFNGRVESASITIDTDVDDLEQLRSRSPHQLTVFGSTSFTLPQPKHNQGDRGHVPPGAIEVRGGPVDPDRYAARYGADGGFTDALRRVARHAGADRLTVVRLPGVRRINVYYLDTGVDELAEPIARLERQSAADGITTVGLGPHAIVRLDFHVDHDDGADGTETASEESPADTTALYLPTGDDALDDAIVNSNDGDDGDDGGAP